MLLYADIIHCIVLIETIEEIMIERKEKQDDARNTTQHNATYQIRSPLQKS